jgi:Zn-dependent protease
MLVEPGLTRYDLHFRLFGFPVRVHPLFWLLSILLGADTLKIGPEYLLIWVAVVFASILVHELGHCLAFRLFGVRSNIVLYGFGGLAIPWSGIRERWRRVAVSLAGPGAGFLLYGLVYGSNRAFGWTALVASPYLVVAYIWLLSVNLYWGLLNLLPVIPLDGGRVSEEVCIGVSPRKGAAIAYQISMLVAGLLSIYCLFWQIAPAQAKELYKELPWWLQLPIGGLWTALMFGLLAYMNYQMLQRWRWTNRHWADERLPWER